MSETERKSQTEDVTESTSVTRWSAERLNEVLHRLIKSTKATKIYRDDRTFTLTFLKLEISVLERKTKCSVRIIPGLGEGGEIKKKEKRKRLIIPFIFILKVFIFVIVVVLICGRKEEV